MYSRWIWAIVALNFGLHLIGISQPLVDSQNWRQADTAAIARNFYGEGMDILYPKVDWRGRTEGYVESEFPLYPWLVALLYKLSGGVWEGWGRLLSGLFSALTVVPLFLLGSELYGRMAGLFSALIFTLSPLETFYGRAFMPEAMMLFFSVLGILGFLRWIEGGSWGWLVCSALSTSLAILIKLPALYLGVPLLFLSYVKFGRRTWTSPKLWLFALLVLVPPLLWYVHAHRLFLTTHLTFGVLPPYGYSKFGTLGLRFDPEFYATLTERFFGVLLTPLGGVLAIVGLLLTESSDLQRLPKWWLLALGTYVLVAAEGNRALDYYQLPLLPPCAISAGRAVEGLLRRDLLEGTALKGKVGLTGVLLFSVMGFMSYAYSHPLYTAGFYHDYFRAGYEIGREVQRRTPQDALVATIDLDENRRAPYRAQNPVLLYYSSRKGWHMTPEEATPERVEELRRMGARYLIAPIGELLRRPKLWRHLKERYPLLARNEQFMVVQLFR